MHIYKNTQNMHRIHKYRKQNSQKLTDKIKQMKAKKPKGYLFKYFSNPKSYSKSLF